MKGLEIKTAGMKALEESVLFRTMTKEEILDVIDAMDPRARRFQKKDMILQDGELVGSMMIVLSGKIHLFHIDPNGNSNLLEVPGPGDTVGMLNAVGKYRLHVSAMALEETELLLIDVRSAPEGRFADNAFAAPVPSESYRGIGSESTRSDGEAGGQCQTVDA